MPLAIPIEMPVAQKDLQNIFGKSATQRDVTHILCQFNCMTTTTAATAGVATTATSTAIAKSSKSF